MASCILSLYSCVLALTPATSFAAVSSAASCSVLSVCGIPRAPRRLAAVEKGGLRSDALRESEANAAGRWGVLVRSANGTCENQGAIVAKSLTKSEA